MSINQKVVLTISRAQVQALFNACDTYIELCRGNFQILNKLLCDDIIKFSNNYVTSSSINIAKATEEFKAKVSKIELSLKESSTLPYSLDSEDISETAKLVIEVYLALKHGWTTDADPKSKESTKPTSTHVGINSSHPDIVETMLTISIPHAKALSSALDLFSRLGIGQVSELSYMVRTSDIPLKNETEDKIADIISDLDSLADILGYGRGGSLGIHNKRVSFDCLACWEVKKVLDKELAYLRDPNPTFKGVNYDGLTTRLTSEPAPRVLIETN